MGHSCQISVIYDQVGFLSLLGDIEPLLHPGIVQHDHVRVATVISLLVFYLRYLHLHLGIGSLSPLPPPKKMNGETSYCFYAMEQRMIY